MSMYTLQKYRKYKTEFTFNRLKTFSNTKIFANSTQQCSTTKETILEQCKVRFFQNCIQLLLTSITVYIYILQNIPIRIVMHYVGE